jgi:uncharacterized surface protein with fasciclin (FAS1) repeats
MKLKTPAIAAVAVLSLGFAGAACASDDSSSSSSATTAAPATTAMTAEKNCVEVAASNPDFSTLVTAVTEAGLAETLATTENITIFAPTNEAFAKLPAGTVDTLLKPENKATLTSILTYHVVGSVVMAADVKPGPVTTLEGSTFTVATTGGKVTITDGKGGVANVTATDVECSNGVIHVIDAVLQPAS